MGDQRESHGKVKTQGEAVNEKEKQEVADEADGDGEEDGGGIVVAVCGDEKETAGENDVGLEKEDHELVEGTADVGGESQTAAVVEY